jgi:hypothetical protein
MFSFFIAGLSIGILGSFHCVGMCGPLALALPINSQHMFSRFTGSLLYNAGRVLCYSMLGAAAGALGEGFVLAGLQQGLSIAFGVVVLLVLAAPAVWPSLRRGMPVQLKIFENLRAFFGRLFFKKNPSTLFAIGFLNGLLPCGMVYIALAAAVAAGSWVGSISFMAAFGLGTLPLMWAIAFCGNLLGSSIRKRIRGAYPYMMALVACLLIVRGMGLGIPYLSPASSPTKKEIHCCVKQ